MHKQVVKLPINSNIGIHSVSMFCCFKLSTDVNIFHCAFPELIAKLLTIKLHEDLPQLEFEKNTKFNVISAVNRRRWILESYNQKVTTLCSTPCSIAKIKVPHYH